MDEGCCGVLWHPQRGHCRMWITTSTLPGPAPNPRTRVGPLGGGGAYALVGAAGAGGGLARLVTGRAGAVCTRAGTEIVAATCMTWRALSKVGRKGCPLMRC